MQLRFRTGIPDEIGGESVVFANAFERPERPGQLSVLLLHAERRHVLAAGDVFALGGGRWRLAGIEPQDGSYAVVVDRLEAEPPVARKLPEPIEFAIDPIGAGDLAALLKSLTPAILATLGAASSTPAGWTTETRSTMHTEWNGGEVGPVVTTRDLARFDAENFEAEVTLTDICYAPDIIDRQELAAFWRADQQRAHIFLRAEGTGPMSRLLSDPASTPVVELVAAAIRNRPA